MIELVFDFFTDEPNVFRDKCGFYYPIKAYVSSLGGHWSFRECWYDASFPAYRVLYSSTDKKKMELTITALGGKYPPDISHTISDCEK